MSGVIQSIARSQAQGPESDARLVGRFKAGEEEAFDEIVRRYQERILNFVYAVVRDLDEARDIAQETFVRAYGRIGRFRGESGLYTWLYRIALNLSINYMRKKKLYSFFSLSDSSAVQLAAPGGPQEDLEAGELSGRIDAAVAQLPPRQRSIFVLRYYEERSHGEIAAMVGTSEGAVRSSYFHAVKKLQNALKDLL